jgi:hypothetical protein
MNSLFYTLRDYSVAGLAVALSLFLIWQNLLLECVPHDEGLLGQSATRFMAGELPHRDFDDPYTGMLNVIHAWAFSIFDVHASSLRYFHFGVFSVVLVWFSFFLKKNFSLLTVILAVICLSMWSVLVYPASMPSWYMVYLSLFAGVLILGSGGSSYKLVAAGILLGIVTLIKINGVLFLFSALWGLLLLSKRDESSTSGNTGLMHALIMSGAILMPLSAIAFLLRHHLDVSHMLYFIFPNLLFGGLLVSLNRDIDAIRFLKNAFSLVAAYLFVLMVYGFYFYLNNGLTELLHGVFVSPMARVGYAQFPPPHWIIVFLILIWAVVSFSVKSSFSVFSVIAVIAAILLSILSPDISRNVILAFISCIPACLMVYAFLKKDSLTAGQVFWIPFSTFGLLLQYPFFNEAYVSFVFVFCLPGMLFVFRDEFAVNKGALCNLLLCVLIILGAIYHSPGIDTGAFLVKKTDYNIPRQKNQRPPFCLDDELISIVHENSREDDPILAFPDSPEVYFFTKRKNPTRRIYDFLSLSEEPYLVYLDLVFKGRIPLVVINQAPAVSPKVEDELLEIISDSYESKKTVGHYVIFHN